MAIYSRSSIQNINNRRFWIRKSKCIIKFKNQPDIDKIYLYAIYLINKHEKVGLKHCYDPKAFIEYSNDIEGVYRNTEEYNLGKKFKVSIVSDDTIADINNKKLNPIVTELFIRGRKLNIWIVFITQSYFRRPKEVTLKSKLFRENS